MEALPAIQYPAILISSAGWHKTADEPTDLLDASPGDDLAEWQDAEILDASGHRYRARRAFRGWPRSSLGVALCRLLGHCVYVQFEFETREAMTTTSFASRVTQFEPLPEGVEWLSPSDVMRHVGS